MIEPKPACGRPGCPSASARLIQASDGVGSVAVLLGAAGREDHDAARRGEQVGGCPQPRRGHAGDALHAFRPVAGDGRADAVEAARALLDVVRVAGTGLGQQVQQPVGQREVGARQRLQVDRRRPRGGRHARVDDDQAATAFALDVEVAHRRRHRLGQVAADEHDHIGLLDVGEREREPVEPERALGRRRGRRHAEPAVVVDAARAQDDPGELAEQVRLLVGETAAAEDARRVGAVGGARARQARGDPGQRLVPADRPQRGVPAVPREGGGYSRGTSQQLRRRESLRAQAAGAGLDPRSRRAVHRHAALQEQ